jgi:hypothetical protein
MSPSIANMSAPSRELRRQKDEGHNVATPRIRRARLHAVSLGSAVPDILGLFEWSGLFLRHWPDVVNVGPNPQPEIPTL